MADLTPTDIVNKDFRVKLRGYAMGEVDDFLQQTSDSLYRVLEENQRLRAQAEDLRARLQRYQETEDLIKNALVLAERTADDLRQQTHQEVELIRREAQEQLRSERAQLEELRQTRLRIIAELRAVLHSHLSLLEAQEGRLQNVSPAHPPGEGA